MKRCPNRHRLSSALLQLTGACDYRELLAAA
jgi:hypothetical protein